MIRSWQRGTKTRNVFVKVAYHPALAVIPTTSIVDTAEIRLHENASCLFVSSRFVEPPDSPTADREKKEKMWKRSRRGNKRRGGAGCQEIPLGSGFGKNEAKSENSILRAYFVQTRPPEFNHRPDCWPILGGPRQESAANPRICHSRVAFEWPIVCAFGIQISTLPAASRAIFGIHPLSRVKWIDTRMLDFILTEEGGLCCHGIIELRNYLFTIDRKHPLNIKYGRAGTAPKRKRQMKVKVRAKIGFMEDGSPLWRGAAKTLGSVQGSVRRKNRGQASTNGNGSAVYNKERREWREQSTKWERNA